MPARTKTSVQKTSEKLSSTEKKFEPHSAVAKANLTNSDPSCRPDTTLKTRYFAHQKAVHPDRLSQKRTFLDCCPGKGNIGFRS